MECLEGMDGPSAADLAAIEAEWPVIVAGMAAVQALARLAAAPVHRWMWRRQRQPRPVAGVWSVDCEVCDDFAGPFATEGLAVQVAGGHDDRFHAGRLTAVTVPVVAGRPHSTVLVSVGGVGGVR